MPARLRRSFFDRSVHEIAPELIGATLLFEGVGGVIVEVEAYHHTDPAAHSFNGQTERNAVMFGPPGYRLRVSLLRHPLVRELRLRGRRQRQRGADPRAASDARPRKDAAAARHDGGADVVLRTRQGCAMRSASRASITGSRSTAHRSSCAHGRKTCEIAIGPRIGITKAVEHAVALRIERLALPQQAVPLTPTPCCSSRP